MADEKIVIQIQDKIDSSIIRKLDSIKTSANAGQAAIDKLQNALGKKNVSNETLKQATAIERLKTATNNAKTSAERFATQQARTAKELQNVAAASSRAEAATLRLKRAQARDARSQMAGGSPLSSLSAIKGGMGAALSIGAGLATGGIIKEIVDLTGAYTGLQNKLKNVTDSQGQLNSVTNRVMEIAIKTRQSVEETAQAFQRFDLALKQLGASQGESLRMTETVNKMLIISGATAGESGSALLQLSQAFNKGKLDGDEFRSVMELMPPVADAIAKKLGVTRGELLKLAPEGKITAQVMREALASVAAEVDEKFGKTIPTLGQALENLRTLAIQMFGEIEKRSGAVWQLKGVVSDFGEWIKENKADIIIFGTKLGEMAKALGNVYSEFIKLKASQFGAIFVVIEKAAEAAMLALNTFARTLKMIREEPKRMALAMLPPLTPFILGGTAVKAAQQTVPEAMSKMAMDQVNEKNLREKTKALDAVNKQLEFFNAQLLKTTMNDPARMGLLKTIGSLQQMRDTLEGFEEWGPLDRERVEGSAKALDNLGKTIKVHLDSFEKMNNLLSKGAPEYLMPTGADTFSGIIKPSQIPGQPMAEGPGDILSRFGFSSEVMGAMEMQFSTITEKYQFFYGQLDMMRKLDASKEKQVTEATLKLKRAEVAEKLNFTADLYGNMSSLMQSGSKDAFRIGKAFALAEAGIRGTLAVQGALGAPPYSFGAIAMATSIGVMSAMNMSKIANTQMPGFKEGGYTGSYGTSQVAGVVHGQEFVSNAAATSKYRPMLERMNKGGAAIAVTIENYGTSKEFEVQQITPDQVRIIARDEIRTQTPSLVASEVMNPNSRVSKAFNNSTSLQRKRV